MSDQFKFVSDTSARYDMSEGFRAYYEILQPLVDMVHHGSLPALRTISFLIPTTPPSTNPYLAHDNYFFLKNNIHLK